MTTALQKMRSVMPGMIILAGLMFLYSAAIAQPAGEPAGCANNTCQMINYSFGCNAGLKNGIVQQLTDCLYCIDAGNRCQNGSTTSQCLVTDTAQGIGDCPVTQFCLCANNPSGAGTASVQSTGNYTGTYSPNGFRYNCVAKANPYSTEIGPP